MVTKTTIKVEPLCLQSCHTSWFERFEFHLIAGDYQTAVPVYAEDGSNLEEVNVAVKKNLSLFIARIDEAMFELLKSLISPKQVWDCTYEECKTAILNQLAPALTGDAVQNFKLRTEFRGSSRTASVHYQCTSASANEVCATVQTQELCLGK